MNKRKILFVDDDELVLKAINRSTREMRQEWDVAFASDGHLALQMMSDVNFDVIVTDLSMPRMSGMDLLAQVKETYPGVIRIVLSGDPDQHNPHKVAGSAHQYLTKPCSSARLRETIQQACARKENVDHDGLEVLVSKLGGLPSLPTLYQKIMVEVQRRNTSLKNIGDIIAKDMSMTSKLLQMVNSPFFGLTRKVSNPAHACRLLGLETVKALVLTSKIFSEFETCHIGRFDLTKLWKHSLSVANFARIIAQEAGAKQDTIDAAFTSGLLHDVGKLILSSNLPADYDRALLLYEQEGGHLFEAERTIFHSTHAAVGAYLVDLWGLPQQIGDGIANHHHPERNTTAILSTALVVHVANQISYDLSEEADPSQLNFDYLHQLGLVDMLESWKEKCAKTRHQKLTL